MITASDFSFVLSGGTSNTSTSLSLGGMPSNTPVSAGSVNNLFGNVTSTESSVGRTDYRCFYVFNDHEEDTLFDFSISIEKLTSGGATVQVGVALKTDIQRVTINGNVTGGSMTLAYQDDPFTVDYSPTDFAANFQAAINSVLSLVGEVEVLESSGSDQIILTVRFKGGDDNRNHEVLTVESNDLTGTDVSIESPVKISDGQPINSIAPSIASEGVPPNGVTFFDDGESIQLTNLFPGDGFPVWLKRTIAAGTDPIADDTVRFKINGKHLF